MIIGTIAILEGIVSNVIYDKMKKSNEQIKNDRIKLAYHEFSEQYGENNLDILIEFMRENERIIIEFLNSDSSEFNSTNCDSLIKAYLQILKRNLFKDEILKEDFEKKEHYNDTKYLKQQGERLAEKIDSGFTAMKKDMLEEMTKIFTENYSNNNQIWQQRNNKPFPFNTDWTGMANICTVKNFSTILSGIFYLQQNNELTVTDNENFILEINIEMKTINLKIISNNFNNLSWMLQIVYNKKLKNQIKISDINKNKTLFIGQFKLKNEDYNYIKILGALDKFCNFTNGDLSNITMLSIKEIGYLLMMDKLLTDKFYTSKKVIHEVEILSEEDEKVIKKVYSKKNIDIIKYKFSLQNREFIIPLLITTKKTTITRKLNSLEICHNFMQLKLMPFYSYETILLADDIENKLKSKGVR